MKPEMKKPTAEYIKGLIAAEESRLLALEKAAATVRKDMESAMDLHPKAMGKGGDISPLNTVIIVTYMEFRAIQRDEMEAMRRIQDLIIMLSENSEDDPPDSKKANEALKKAGEATGAFIKALIGKLLG